MYESIHAFLASLGLVLLLLAILRHRRHRLPRLLPAGVVICCVAQLYPLATAFIGIERMNALVAGRLFEMDDLSHFVSDGIDVSEDFIFFSQASHTVGELGALLIACGFLGLVGRLIRQQPVIHPRS